MNGHALIFQAVSSVSAASRQVGEIHKFTEPPTLQFMRDAVGGDIELVPGFDWIGGRACVAFCNEHGKLHLQFPLNVKATLLWEDALRERGTGQLRDAHGNWVDWLVGPVLVLYGDDEFLAAL